MGKQIQGKRRRESIRASKFYGYKKQNVSSNVLNTPAMNRCNVLYELSKKKQSERRETTMEDEGNHKELSSLVQRAPKNNARCNQLYKLSNKSQQLGKQRRQNIRESKDNMPLIKIQYLR